MADKSKRTNPADFLDQHMGKQTAHAWEYTKEVPAYASRR